MIHTAITRDPIVASHVLDRVGRDEDGATVLFLGVVRNHADERQVSGMRYDAYEEMATEMLETIAREAAERCATDRVAVEHRIGVLSVGEVSVAIAVSAPHRAEAFEASRYVIDEIKMRLPVWKKESYVSGEQAWVEGTLPPAPTPSSAGRP